MKKCITCGVLKPLTDFYKHLESKDGHRNECKNCCKKQATMWEKNNIEKARKYKREYLPKWKKRNFKKVKEYKQRWRKKIHDNYGLGTGTIQTYGFQLALKIYDKYDRKCVECGEENDLTLHHLDGKGSNYKEKGLKPNNSEDNLILICRKCHGSIHGKESWEKRKKRGKKNG